MQSKSFRDRPKEGIGMKRLILHIGTHKTGTTAVQGFLKVNAELLERETGIFYPVYPAKYSRTKPAHNGKFLHCQASMRASGGKRERADVNGGSDWIREEFAKQVQEHDIILLSDEQIWKSLNSKKNYLKSLHDVISECGIEQTDVVVYFRRQDEYLESYWKQWIKSDIHYTKTLPDHLLDQERDVARYLNYARGVRRLENTFGKEHVIVRRYQRDTLAKGDIRYDFADAIGFTITDEYILPETPDDPRKTKGNVSLSNNLTEIIRCANMAPSYHDASFHDRFFKDYRNAARTASIVSPESAGKASVLSPDQREQLLKRFGKGNAYIARNYLGIESGELFDPPRNDLAHWEPDALSLQRDSTVFFTEVIAQMATRIEDLEGQVAELKRGGRLRRLFTKIQSICRNQ